MRSALSSCALLLCLGNLPRAGAAEPLPFNHKVEVYRQKEGDVIAFAVRLEQPFLAEEFEKSNYLRLQAQDANAYLIYPKETRFHQKHAEFYGRLRGQGKAKLRLSYEIISENLDGSRRVDVRQGDIEVSIPPEPTGPKSIYQEWAKQQNGHFQNLLNYYPDETFFQYVLLQSRDRYGVAAPTLVKTAPDQETVESDLYDVLTGSLAVQETLQRQVLSSGPRRGDLNIPISNLSPPHLQSMDYARLLEEKQKKNVQPAVHEIARLIPEDQYFLHFHSLTAAGELLDLADDWGDNLLRLFTLRAQDNRVQEKLEDQLALRRGPLTKLFADLAVTELAVTGADPFVLEGTDVTFVFRVKSPELFDRAAAGWLAEVKAKYPEVAEREFNYRGHKVLARYTTDRLVSSFVARHEDYVIYSNSHAAIRKVLDAVTGKTPALIDALDYRYVTTVLPPSGDTRSGYFFGSEAFVRRLVGPELKIAEKRRVQCFNNLVMLNNASMFYRLEYGRSPASLTDLIEGRFIDPARIVCPHGGAYAIDAAHDTCTCSLHNRLKYLTPNAELPVLRISADERQEYERYQQRYQGTWQQLFDPIAVRITVAPKVKLELCVLPFANGSLYPELKGWLDDRPRPLDTARIAPSAVTSLLAVPGRKAIGEALRVVPGVPEALQADPTLTDLTWIGDRISVHLCDAETIVEIDPTRLRALDLPLLGRTPILPQTAVALILSLIKMPAYVSIDVEDKDKAARLLEQLAAKIFLQRGQLSGLPTALDAYRLPDYKQHALYVLSFQVYALKVRLHVALVGNQLVAATRPEILRQVIDVSSNPESVEPATAHVLVRLNRRGLGKLHDDLQLYWSEKARLACHHNAISIYNLVKLYDTPMTEVPRLAESKYGVVYFCPDHGAYEWNDKLDQVLCTVHGNRQHSQQNPRLNQRSSFARFIEGLEEVDVSLRFGEEALFTTVEIVRAGKAK